MRKIKKNDIVYILFIIINFSTFESYGKYGNNSRNNNSMIMMSTSTSLPQFYAPLENITATQGRDVHFTCVVNHLGEYRVAWIKSDSKAILAIHNRLVAHNGRLSVTHNGHNTWKLHISNIEKSDSGSYMCQINTDPMRWQLGYLKVTIAPDILNDEDTMSDGYQALEGGSIKLRCRATGEPQPEVSWRREDGKAIAIRRAKRIEFHEVVIGENLTLNEVDRSDMGVYLCLAKSSIPPIMSKRFQVQVNFSPQVRVKNHFVGVPLTKDVTLQCNIEASPKATFHWLNNKNEPIITNSKMRCSETFSNQFSSSMYLTIRKLENRDYGEYTCVAENTVGRAQAKIRLKESYLFETSTFLLAEDQLYPREEILSKLSKSKEFVNREDVDLKKKWHDKNLTSTIFNNDLNIEDKSAKRPTITTITTFIVSSFEKKNVISKIQKLEKANIRNRDYLLTFHKNKLLFVYCSFFINIIKLTALI